MTVFLLFELYFLLGVPCVYTRDLRTFFPAGEAERVEPLKIRTQVIDTFLASA